MLEVSVEQTLLSEFILRSVSGGVTPSTIPYMTDENLAKVHRTPSVMCGPRLRSLSRSPGENLSYPPGVDNGKTQHLHLTYSLVLTYIKGLSYTCLLIYHGSVIYPISGTLLTWSFMLMRGETTLIIPRLNILSILASILVLDNLVEALCLSPLSGRTSTRTYYISYYSCVPFLDT